MMRRFWTRRKGVSTIIGGLIILTLFLSALSVMVFISQQYDAYQSTLENMNQRDVDASSENLVGVYPGIEGGLNSTTGVTCPVPTGCNLLVSNEAGIGTQITRIYIWSNYTYPNGTLAGCWNLCIFDEASAPASLHFLESSAFVNPSEYSHEITLYTNSTLVLPIISPGLNSITLVTARGRTFAFQYPFNVGGTVSYLTTGIMQIAYSNLNGGYSSSKEPAAGGTGGAHYCHSTDSATEIVAPSPYGTLWFVNPWISSTIFNNALPVNDGASNSPVGYNDTMLYVYVNVTNSQNQLIVITGGNIWLQVTYLTKTGTSPNPYILVMGGPLIGTYYDGAWATSPSVSPSTTVTLIYKINSWNWVVLNPSTWSPVGLTFSGEASMTSESANGYFGGSTVVDGLYVSGSC